MAKHPFPHATCETFTFLARRWCITQAWELIESDPNAAQLVEQATITGLDQFLPLTDPTPGHMKLIAIDVDTEYAATTDLTKPVLVAQIFSHSEEDLGVVVIDGWHRIYRARTEGLTHTCRPTYSPQKPSGPYAFPSARGGAEEPCPIIRAQGCECHNGITPSGSRARPIQTPPPRHGRQDEHLRSTSPPPPTHSESRTPSHAVTTGHVRRRPRHLSASAHADPNGDAHDPVTQPSKAHPPATEWPDRDPRWTQA